MKILRIFIFLAFTCNGVPLNGGQIKDVNLVWANDSVFNENDFSKARKILIESFSVSYQNAGIRVDRINDACFDTFKIRLKRKDSKFFFVYLKEKGTVVGFAAFSRLSDGIIEIDRIAVQPSCWKKGFGRLLLFSILDKVSRIEKIVLATRKNNGATVKFYQKLGFQEGSYLPAYFNPKIYQGFEFNIIRGGAFTEDLSDLVDVQKLNPNINVEIVYATPNNFTGQILYDSAKCYLRRAVAEKLDKIQKELETIGLG